MEHSHLTPTLHFQKTAKLSRFYSSCIDVSFFIANVLIQAFFASHLNYCNGFKIFLPPIPGSSTTYIVYNCIKFIQNHLGRTDIFMKLSLSMNMGISQFVCNFLQKGLIIFIPKNFMVFVAIVNR